MTCFGMEVEECGDRQAFLLTTDKYGPGALRIGSSSEEVSALGVLERYQDGWPRRIWEHTMRTFDKALTADSDGPPK